MLTYFGLEVKIWMENGVDRLMRLTDWMGDVTNSRTVADSLTKQGVVPAERVCVIPNGLVLDKFVVTNSNKQEVRRDLGVAEEDFLWLAVGRLEEPKDYPNLLQAFRIVLNKYEAQLYVAGQGSLTEDLERQAIKLGISNRVVFLACVATFRNFYRVQMESFYLLRGRDCRMLLWRLWLLLNLW